MKKRVFIGIDISGDARDAAARYIDDLAGRWDKTTVKWVTPANLHVTLKFLGGVAPDKLNEVIELVDRAALVTREFEFSIEGAGAFPSSRRPRTLWLGVTEHGREMTGLVARLDMALEPHGYQAEQRSFRPHLTIGRVRDRRTVGELGSEHSGGEFGPFLIVCREVIVFESQTGPTGSIYTRLATSRLRGEREG